MGSDAFPSDRLAAMLRRMPAYLRLAWRLAKDPLLSKARRTAVVAAAGYLASPVDLVPGVIPLVGQLDDLAVALAALKLALDGLSPARRRAHLDAVGLTDEELATDLRTIGATLAWLARSGVRLTTRLIRVGGRAAGAGVAFAGRTARRVASRGPESAGSTRDQAADRAGSLRDRAVAAAGSTRGRAGSLRDRAVAAAGSTRDRAADVAGSARARLPRRSPASGDEAAYSHAPARTDEPAPADEPVRT